MITISIVVDSEKIYEVPAVENVVVKLRCWDSEASVIWNVAGASFNM